MISFLYCNNGTVIIFWITVMRMGLGFFLHYDNVNFGKILLDSEENHFMVI